MVLKPLSAQFLTAFCKFSFDLKASLTTLVSQTPRTGTVLEPLEFAVVAVVAVLDPSVFVPFLGVLQAKNKQKHANKGILSWFFIIFSFLQTQQVGGFS